MLAQSCPVLCDPMIYSPPDSSVHGIFQQEYWSGLPFPPSGDLPYPGIKPKSVTSSALAGGFFTPSTTWEVLLPNYDFRKVILDFLPDSSIGKESACNAGDPGWIPGLGRSTAEEIGYPLQYSWAFLVTQLVKNLPAVQETWVRFLGWEDLLEMRKATHFSILAWRTPWTVYSP